MSKYFLVIVFFLTAIQGISAQSYKLEDIYIRDPYIYANPIDKMYYLYRSSSTQLNDGKTVGGVEVFKSKDLKNWEGPQRVLTLPSDNWITGDIWAPEMHQYKGKYYLFTTINSDIKWKASLEGWPDYTFRGTQIFKSDSPEGPFVPFADKMPQTPYGEMCLDGTLYVENNIPYMIYCHEWVELQDGAMELLMLTDDLSKSKGNPMKLFNSSAAVWSTGKDNGANLPKAYITDGCYVYKSKKSGKLFMIWSSFKDEQYAVGIAESVTGKVSGPWKQQDKTLFDKNGGHGMIFSAFDGKLYIIFHGPNTPSGSERARMFELEDTGNTLRLK